MGKFKLVYPLIAPWLYSSHVADDRSQTAELSSRGVFKRVLNNIQPAPYSSEDWIARADVLLDKKVTLLNKSAQFEAGVQWSGQVKGDPLWVETLHYFEWTRPLLEAFKKTGNQIYVAEIISLIKDWIRQNPPGKGPGWRPYPLSRRLICWMKAWIILESSELKLQEEIPAFYSSIKQQTHFLSKNLEFSLMNNHLIANGAALAWVGTVFADWKEAERWRKTGYELVWEECLRQVNREGFHAERSTSYQLLVYQDLVEVVDLALLYGIPVPADVLDRLESMEQAALGLVRPDGQLPLLNDAVRGYPRQLPSFLLSSGEGEGDPSRVYPETGYAVMRSGWSPEDAYLVFDCGPLGPDWNPGHGHADALSFELYASGLPLIVDPGTYAYHEQPWRDYFRGTSAHNTLVVDGKDQSELWGSFRVGRMARSRLIKWETSPHVDLISAEHDGYARLRPPVHHRRTIRYFKPDRWRIEDMVWGEGEHTFEILFHFSNRVNVFPVGQTAYRVTDREDQDLMTLEHTLPSSCQHALEKGWVSEGWYQKHRSPVLHYTCFGEPPLRWAFVFKLA